MIINLKDEVKKIDNENLNSVEKVKQIAKLLVETYNSLSISAKDIYTVLEKLCNDAKIQIVNKFSEPISIRFSKDMEVESKIVDKHTNAIPRPKGR